MDDRPLASRLGLYLAVSAIAVNAPRLVLAFFAADGIVVGERPRAALLALTGLATGVVLTGGGAYLAHALAREDEHRAILGLVWLLVLACGAVLITPLLVASLDGRQLAQVLPSSPLRWAWSAVAVLAVELVAAGSMVAHAAQRERRRRTEDAEREIVELARERNRLRDELSRLAGEAVPARGRRRGRRGPRAGDRQVPCRNGCGFVGRSTQAERGHQRRCPRRPPAEDAEAEAAGGQKPPGAVRASDRTQAGAEVSLGEEAP